MTRCSFGFHRWGKWTTKSRQVCFLLFNPQHLISTETWQERECALCGLKQRKEDWA